LGIKSKRDKGERLRGIVKYEEKKGLETEWRHRLERKREREATKRDGERKESACVSRANGITVQRRILKHSVPPCADPGVVRSGERRHGGRRLMVI